MVAQGVRVFDEIAKDGEAFGAEGDLLGVTEQTPVGDVQNKRREKRDDFHRSWAPRPGLCAWTFPVKVPEQIFCLQ